ncbi:MAG TPA: YkgJ family cysteine cluster protein [Kofleriaceae bacterium]|nr:YkgJ family cysteine cluster protein [Kofleriaceae bacterium]
MAGSGGDDDTRALRAAWLAIEEDRADLLRLAAQVVALTEELGARDPEAVARVHARVAELVPELLDADLRSRDRLALGDFEDKYEIATDDGPPCAELLPICEARCCTFVFALSTQDLDEGVIRWDRGQPYLIRHDDGACTHLDRHSHGCTAYDHRPAPCRRFDCRADPRVWTDYPNRILAPEDTVADPPARFDLHDRVRRRELALAGERMSLRRGQAPGS